MKLQQLELIRYKDPDTGEIFKARYQSTDPRFGLFVKRLDINHELYIQESDIVTADPVSDTKEIKKFVKAAETRERYQSHKDILGKLSPLVSHFLKNPFKVELQILNKNWDKQFEGLPSPFVATKNDNKWGNSANIILKQSTMTQEVYTELSIFFDLKDDPNSKDNIQIYNLLLGLELLSNAQLGDENDGRKETGAKVEDAPNICQALTS